MKQNKKILDTELMIPTKNALRRNNLVNLEELSQNTRQELSRIPGLGKKGIMQIEEVLFNHGYRLECRHSSYHTKYKFDEDKLAVIVPRLKHQIKTMLSMQKAVYESLHALEEAMESEGYND